MLMGHIYMMETQWERKLAVVVVVFGGWVPSYGVGVVGDVGH